MLKSYRWMVAGIFGIMSFYMLQHRFSFSTSIFNSAPIFEVVGIEEKEIIYSTMSRIEKHKEFTTMIFKINEAIKNETLPILLAHSNQFEKITIQEGLGLVFPEQFFKSDPFTQEVAMTELFSTVSLLHLSRDGSLAQVPQKQERVSSGSPR